MPTVRQRYVSELDRLIARGDRLDKRQARRLLQLLNQARLEVQDHITGTDWSIASSTVLELRIQRTMARIAADWQLDISEYQAQRWNDGAAVADEFLADFGGEAERLNIPLEATQLNVLQDFSAKLVKDLTKKVIDDISTTIRMGILGGKTPFETIKDLGRKLVDKDGKPAPGVWGTVAQRAEVVQRTEANRAFGLAQQARLEQHEQERPGLKKTWRTAADSRVRDSHVDAGERYLPGGDPGPIPVDAMFELHVSSSEASKSLPAGTYKARYPRDPRLPPGLSVQCRCVSSPWRDEWEDGSVSKPKKLPTEQIPGLMAPPVQDSKTQAAHIVEALKLIDPRLRNDPQLAQKVESNWRTILTKGTGAHGSSGTATVSDGYFNKLKEALNANAENPILRQIMTQYGDIAVIPRRKPAATGEAAEQLGNITFIYETPFDGEDGERTKIAGTRAPKGGQATAAEGGNLADTLRHEYGHNIYRQLDAETKWGMADSLPKDPREITRYAGANSEEAFCEAVSLLTNPLFERTEYSADALEYFRAVANVIGLTDAL